MVAGGAVVPKIAGNVKIGNREASPVLVALPDHALAVGCKAPSPWQRGENARFIRGPLGVAIITRTINRTRTWVLVITVSRSTDTGTVAGALIVKGATIPVVATRADA